MTPEWEIDQLAGNLMDRSPVFSVLFMTLRDWLSMSDEEATDCLFEVFSEIINGVPLDIIIENIKILSDQEWIVDVYAEVEYD